MQIPQVPVLPLIKCSTTPFDILIHHSNMTGNRTATFRPIVLCGDIHFSVSTETTRRALNNAEDSPLVSSPNDSTIDPGASSTVMIGDKSKVQLHRDHFQMTFNQIGRHIR
jgi:hypothetical protein